MDIANIKLLFKEAIFCKQLSKNDPEQKIKRNRDED